MKRYEKPSIELLTIGSMSHLLADSGLEIHNGTGDGPQLSKRKKDIVDDLEDDGDYGW